MDVATHGRVCFPRWAPASWRTRRRCLGNKTMRITNIEIANTAPVRRFLIDAGSSVVIIAGANGSGKTRIKQAIVETFRNPSAPQASLQLAATREEEEKAWGAPTLSVARGTGSSQLQAYMNTRTKGNTYVGTVVQVDSDRSVRQVKYQTWGLATSDPDDEENTLGYYLSPFVDRWTQFMNRIHQKAASRDQKIAMAVKNSPAERTVQDLLASFPDPFTAYQEIFARLLPGKTLDPIDPKSPRDVNYRVGGSAALPFPTLSSGEQEVVKVAFELAARRISHSVVFIDEPELHLHPTLTFRLLETLKTLGDGTNQFILFTHSADLISTYYSTGNVYFIDNASQEENQARQLSSLADAHFATARAVGANLGLFAVGKKIIFIEGNEASADRVVYHRAAQLAFPDAYLLPIGGVENLMALRSIVHEIGRAVFGIDLFMIRDRDGLTDSTIAELESSRRLRCLTRRHVENYLLDDELLAEVARQLYLPAHLRQPEAISEALHRAAQESLMAAVMNSLKEWVRMYGSVAGPKVRDAHRMSIDDLVGAAQDTLQGATSAVVEQFKGPQVESFLRSEYARLSDALNSDEWRILFPGKLVFNRFCADTLKAESARVREASADLAMAKHPAVLKDIVEIMEGFKGLSA